MKNLQLYLLSAIITSLCYPAYGQLEDLTVRVKGGFNLSSVLTTNLTGSSSASFHMTPGYNFGISGEIPVDDEMFAFEPGLFFTTKGYMANDYQLMTGAIARYEERVTLNYLNAIFTTKAYYDLDQVRIFALMGPYAGIGLSGRIEAQLVNGNNVQSAMVPVLWGFGAETHFHRLDYGLSLGVGAEYDLLQVQVLYNFGLINITNLLAHVSNHNFSISLGYAIIK